MPNRVIVLIDEPHGLLRTYASYPKPSGTTNAMVCTSSGGAIYEKDSSLSSINFLISRVARIVDADQYVHNVSSARAEPTSTSGALIIADVNATSRYWYSYQQPKANEVLGPGGATTGTQDLGPARRASVQASKPRNLSTHLS